MDRRRFGLGTVLYILNQDLSKVLLLKLKAVKRNIFGADWGNVGGKIDFGETSLENCIREAQEEIGVTFKSENIRLLYVREIPNFFDGIHAVQFIYGTTLDEKTPIILGQELDSFEWFRLSNLPEKTLDTKESFYESARLFKEKYL